MILDRIQSLCDYVGFTTPVTAHNVTETLDLLDLHLSVDTATISSLECQCLYHIGKACHARRQVGARVALLAQAVAREKIKKEIKDLQDAYAYG